MNRGERAVIYTFSAMLGAAMGYWLVQLGWAL